MISQIWTQKQPGVWSTYQPVQWSNGYNEDLDPIETSEWLTTAGIHVNCKKSVTTSYCQVVYPLVCGEISILVESKDQRICLKILWCHMLYNYVSICVGYEKCFSFHCRYLCKSEELPVLFTGVLFVVWKLVNSLCIMTMNGVVVIWQNIGLYIVCKVP